MPLLFRYIGNVRPLFKENRSRGLRASTNERVMHRLFVALRPSPAIRQHCLEAMLDGPPGWAWQDDEQLHVTLRYIGEVERPMAEDIAATLSSLRSPPLELGIDGVGWFDQGPRGALFARAVPKEPLAALHRKVDRALTGIGL